jgi:CRISPR-associated protein Cas8a1/Csx13
MKIGLFDPGMTHLHKVGLAGLYMSLKKLDENEFTDLGAWKLSPTAVEFEWNETPKPLFEKIVEKSFLVKNGMVDFKAHHGSGIGDLGKYLIHQSISTTFLQHGRHRDTEKKEEDVAFQFEDKTIFKTFKRLHSYNHQFLNKLNLFDKKDLFRKSTQIIGWLYPGGGVRHYAFQKETALLGTPVKILPLLFSVVSTLYFIVSKRQTDGKFDSRKGAAIIIPNVTDLEAYAKGYERYLNTPEVELYAEGLGDAGLKALMTLNIVDPTGAFKRLVTDSCLVITMGTVPWSTQQKTRTGIFPIKGINADQLNRFYAVNALFQNHRNINDKNRLVVLPSPCRGLFAENIATNRPWFLGFSEKVKSQKLAQKVFFERRKLHQMVHTAHWSNEAEQLLVEAVHIALRNRYGALAARAKEKNETVRFDREFEKIRTALMRVKNSQTMRAELADIFARGNINKTLQQNWKNILPLYTSDDWQRVRDLTLLALASYVGKGSDEVEKQIDTTDEEE